MSGSEQMVRGPPYPPTNAAIGGTPAIKIDDPICAVLIPFFAVAAAANVANLRFTIKRNPQRIFSALGFGFCIARIVALTTRLVWASHLDNANIAIAANVFAAAGVIILFMLNIVFTRRVLRDYAAFGRHPAIKILRKFFIFSTLASLVMLVVTTVYNFFTLDENVHYMTRQVMLFALTYLAFIAFLPIPAAFLGMLFPVDVTLLEPRARFRARYRLLLFTATLLFLGAGFRAGAAWDPRPVDNPAWYHHRANYYIFNYALELVVIYSFVLSRWNQRFYLPLPNLEYEPDSGTETGGEETSAEYGDTSADEKPGKKKPKGTVAPPPTGLAAKVLTEGDVFGDVFHDKS